MRKLKCWKREPGTYGWENKKEDLIVSIMKAPGDKNASLVMGKGTLGTAKETNPKTVKEALKIANKYMKNHNKC